SALAHPVSIGTNANTTLLINTEFNASTGPNATANESARLCVPSRYAVSATRTNPMMLPVSTPATRVKPPRQSALPVTRSETVAEVEFSDASTSGCAGGSSGPGRSECCVIVGMIGHFGNVLGVDNPVTLVQHENRAAFDTKILNQGPVSSAE